MAPTTNQRTSPFKETVNLQLGSEWHTRLLLSLLYIEYTIYSWGWTTSGLPEFSYNNTNAVSAWVLKFISVVIVPLRSIWAANKFCKVSIRLLSAGLHYFCLVFFFVCILIMGVVPFCLIYHTVNYH